MKTIFICTFAIVEVVMLILGLGLIFSNSSTLVGGVVLLSIMFILFLFVVVSYNRMVKARNKIKEAFALIDIQLKLRFDLIPNLVKVVKKYTDHEKELLAEITKLRKLATKAETDKDKLEYANKLVPYVKSLVVVAENYPELKASKLYQSFMEQLSDVEDRLVAARRIYDSNVNIYNTMISVFPVNLLSCVFGFKKEELFKIDAGETVKIK